MSMHQALVGTLIVKGLSEADAVWIADKYLFPLEEDARTLAALEAYGVDNWDGYDEAIQSLEEDDDDSED